MSPDGENVYGSMRDYFRQMSDGEFDLTGYVLNNDSDGDGKPDWLSLSKTKNYYHNSSRSLFKSDAKSLATSAGLDISTNSSTKLCIIYAGHMYRKLGGLNPSAGGATYVMSEKFAPYSPYDAERADATFAGIGTHCHEFGHLLGWPDTYTREIQNNTKWTLMAAGNYNNRMHAPAPVCPEFRIEKGWVTPVNITSDITFSADYSLKDPEVFRIEFDSDPSRYFLIENRSFSATMNFNGSLVPDYNNFLPWNWINNSGNLPTQGLLVWTYRKNTSSYPWDPY